MPGQDEVGPADGEALEHRDREHALGLLGERAHGRVGRGLVARDDQEADRLRVLLVAVRARAQASATPRPFGVAGRWKAAQPGFAVEPSRCAELREPGAAAAAAADQIRTARSEAERAPRAACRASARRPGRPRRRCGAPADPEVDDRRAVGDLLVADDDDELRRADRRERRAEGVERRATSPPAARPSARRAPGAAACRARRPARPSPSRRARSRSGPWAPRSSASARSSASSQESSSKPRRRRALERVDDPVVGVEVRVGEAALVAEPALVDLGVVAERIRLTLPSRVVAETLQPTGQRPQTVGTFWISHGRPSKRYWVEVSAPTGQSSITLPLNGAR